MIASFLADIPAPAWTAAIAALATIVLAYMAQRNKDAAEATAKKQDKKLETIHTLVNSGHLIQLKLHAVTAARLAEITGDERDKDAAILAQRTVTEHEAQQAKLDANEAAN